jgi:hypothetical protein
LPTGILQTIAGRWAIALMGLVLLAGSCALHPASVNASRVAHPYLDKQAIGFILPDRHRLPYFLANTMEGSPLRL